MLTISYHLGLFTMLLNCSIASRYSFSASFILFCLNNMFPFLLCKLPFSICFFNFALWSKSTLEFEKKLLTDILVCSYVLVLGDLNWSPANLYRLSSLVRWVPVASVSSLVDLNVWLELNLSSASLLMLWLRSALIFSWWFGKFASVSFSSLIVEVTLTI